MLCGGWALSVRGLMRVMALSEWAPVVAVLLRSRPKWISSGDPCVWDAPPARLTAVLAAMDAAAILAARGRVGIREHGV